MGQEYSHPQPGTTPLVICAGFPRTGTTSLCIALETLLSGPVYHGGTQIFLGPPSGIRTATKVLNQWPTSPTSSPTKHAQQLKDIKTLFSGGDGNSGKGYVAIADSPGCTLVPELLALYPDAKVNVSTRDVEGWVRSMATISNAATMWFLRAVLFPLPTMRHMVDYIDALRRQWVLLYGEREPVTRKSYERHLQRLREVVPAEKLFFVDVKDGWGPLCEILGKEVPVAVEFPRVNDGKAIDEFSARMVTKGLVAWAKILAVGGTSLAVGVWGWKRM